MAYSVFAGLAIMTVGTALFAAGQLKSCPNRERARTVFALANVWPLLLIPMSCCFNILDGLAHGYSGHIAPIPILGNSLSSFGLCWLFYIVSCIFISIAIIKHKNRTRNTNQR